MAHSNRRDHDKRPHPVLYPKGSVVEVQGPSGPIRGKIYDTDGGGWIYVNWIKPTIALPDYLRSTNVALVSLPEGT